MKVFELFEAQEKETLLPVDAIAMMLFKKKSGLIIDTKRDKSKSYIGVAHEKSQIRSQSGKSLNLTFDNSTDSEEFEIDSLTPLKIEKGDDIDKAIKKLFVKHDLGIKKGTGYILKGDASYLREIHLGKKLGKPAVKLVADLLKILKGLESPDENQDDEDTEKETKKVESPKQEKKAD